MTNPVPSPLLGPVLGPRTCYDLNGPRRSLVNDTGYTAVVYADANCTSLSAVITPTGFLNEVLPINSVLFIPV